MQTENTKLFPVFLTIKKQKDSNFSIICMWINRSLIGK